MATKDAGNGPEKNWTSKQAYIFAVVCLLLGAAVGYLVRGSGSGDDSAGMPASANTGMPASMPGQQAQAQPTPEQMAQMAAKQAEPLLEQLKTRPNDAALLANIANVYYDGQQFDQAISYYQRSLKIRPENVEVRSDMATCYWYKNDANDAISQYEKSLTYNPKHASTLYNLGVVRWQGKGDPQGAVNAWQTLLRTNPNYENKARVLELISRARQHSAGGIPAPKG
jgi:cytochrome c-type biogenesis protein CcmH/NrfG